VRKVEVTIEVTVPDDMPDVAVSTLILAIVETGMNYSELDCLKDGKVKIGVPYVKTVAKIVVKKR